VKISKELRISPYDTGVILNKAVEEKEESRRRNKTMGMMLRKNKNIDIYLYLPKHTNFFLIERLH
jgi:hypothetical protein